MAQFSRISAEAEAAIAEIHDAVLLITTRQQILANALQLFNYENQNSYTKSVRERFFATKKISADSIYRGLFIQLGSVFEHFVRRCMEEVLDVYIKKAEKFEDLPESIISKNMFYSGIALQTIHEGISGRRLNYEEIARKLGTCFKGNEKFEINKNCFTLFIGNCTSKHVKDLFSSVNVNGHIWAEIGKQKFLQTYFGTRGAKETEKLTISALDEYIRIRNGIVHRGELYKTVTENDTIERSNFFVALCRSISGYLSSIEEP